MNKVYSVIISGLRISTRVDSAWDNEGEAEDRAEYLRLFETEVDVVECTLNEVENVEYVVAIFQSFGGKDAYPGGLAPDATGTPALREEVLDPGITSYYVPVPFFSGRSKGTYFRMAERKLRTYLSKKESSV